MPYPWLLVSILRPLILITLRGDYPCPSRKYHKLQIGTKLVVGLNDIPEHVQIGGDLFNVVFYRGENFGDSDCVQGHCQRETYPGSRCG